LATIAEDRIAVDVEWPAADMATFELGASHAGADALDNKVALQLGDRADDHDHGAAQRSAGIDVLTEGHELDLQMSEFVEDLEEVTDGAGDAIKRPD
jgi:hypothetical protein